MATGAGKTFTAVHVDLPAASSTPGPSGSCSSSTAPTWASRPDSEFQQYRHPRRRPQVHRALQRPAPARRDRARQLAQVVITTIQRLYSMLRGETSVGRRRDEASAVRATTSRRRPSTCRLQPGDPDRDVRPHHRRRVPPLDLQPLAAGAGVLRRLPRRPDRHAGTRRRSASSTRTSSASTPTSRPSPMASTSTTTSTHPDRDQRARRHDRGRQRPVRMRDRRTRKRALGSSSTTTSTTRQTQIDRTCVSRDQIRTVCSTFRDDCHRALPRPHATSRRH